MSEEKNKEKQNEENLNQLSENEQSEENNTTDESLKNQKKNHDSDSEKSDNNSVENSETSEDSDKIASENENEAQESQTQKEHKPETSATAETEESDVEDDSATDHQSKSDETESNESELKHQKEDSAGENAERDSSATDHQTESTETEINESELNHQEENSAGEDAEEEEENEATSTAVKRGQLDKNTIPKKNYSAMSPDELVMELTQLVKNEKVQHIREHVNDIKAIFDKKFDDIIQEKKKAFLDEGGNIIDFQYTSPIKKRFNAVYFDYREKRDQYYAQLKKNLQQNLKTRISIIEELKNMIGSGESMSENYRKFKELQERWKNAGDVPKNEKGKLWNDYHHHVERFYDFLHLDKEFRELDYKHNLDQKLKLISRAEELAKEEDVERAFRELQLLHKIWKEELGPVEKQYSDEIWEKFSEATKKIHENRRAYFAELDKEREKNLAVKEDVIEQVKKISDEDIKTHRDAQDKIKMIEKLRDIFKKAGKVPRKDKDRVWDELKEHTRVFNRKKNQFYKDLKKQQFENLEKKEELIQIAEKHKDSEDFESTTPLMKKIQADWKKIGHVPRKESDKIWKQFKAACNHYFDRLHNSQEKVHDEAFENFLKKKDLVSKLKSLVISGKKDKDLPQIEEIIDEWSELGRVPDNKRYVEGKFHKTLDQIFKKIEDVDFIEGELIKYKPRMHDFEQSDNPKFIYKEINFLQSKVEETEDKINQFENNKSFLSPSDQANEMINDINQKIEGFQKELAMWKTKLSQVRSLVD